MDLKMEQREALEYLVNLGEKKEPIIELDQGTFSRVSLNRVTEPVASKLTVSTLTGLVDYIKTCLLYTSPSPRDS